MQFSIQLCGIVVYMCSPVRVSDCGRFLVVSPMELGSHHHLYVALMPALWGQDITGRLPLISLLQCRVGRLCGVRLFK